ncbi:MAG: alanine dehydrogenase, partial [Gammaproteobacteria bacterium]
MRVGVPKEIKNHEYRVGLTPAGARELTERGHEVLVQKGAGGGIGIADAQYEGAGAKIVPTAATVFEKAEMVVKVKEPQPVECKMLRDGQILFTYLHLAPDPEQCKGLVESKCIAIAYETVTDPRGGLPLLAPMSEVAGRMSIQAGAHALEKAQGGLGVLLGGVPGVAPAEVVVIGGGVVGYNAARVAIGMGAKVTVLDRSTARLKYLDELFENRLLTLYSTTDALEQAVTRADLVIGAVLVPGAAAPKLVTRAMLKKMKPGAVIVDVAIDQGGCFETSKATTHQDPTYVVDGIVHYCVANMPGGVARTS